MPANILINRLAIIFWVSVCIMLGFTDMSFIIQNVGVDSELLVELSSDDTELSDDGSYAGTARLFRLVPSGFLLPVVLFISALSIIIFMKDIKRIPSMIIAMYITLPALLLFLTRPQKETIIILMTIIILGVFKSRMREWQKLLILALVYGAYAVFVRQYYFLILMFFFTIYFVNKIPFILSIAIGLTILAILIILPEEIFLQTQGMRDAVNYYLGTNKRVIRTGFINPFPADNIWHFTINYIYSAFRLHLPIFFTFSYKEILHIISIFIFFRLIFIGMDAKNCQTCKLCSLLIISHILTLNIFEPDVGSYLRHLTSVFLYLTPMLLLYDSGNYRKIRFI